MSPSEMSQAAARKLISDISIDGAELDRLASNLSSALGPGQSDARLDAAARAYVAVEIHRYYTAFETIAERVAKALDGVMPSGPRWHEELLAQIRRDIAGVRPSLVDAEAHVELTRLLSFRHFFRHAYAVDLDWTRLEEHRARVARIHPAVRAGIDRLADHLRAVLEALERNAGT